MNANIIGKTVWTYDGVSGVIIGYCVEQIDNKPMYYCGVRRIDNSIIYDYFDKNQLGIE